jgi:hypothetical protein
MKNCPLLSVACNIRVAPFVSTIGLLNDKEFTTGVVPICIPFKRSFDPVSSPSVNLKSPVVLEAPAKQVIVHPKSNILLLADEGATIIEFAIGTLPFVSKEKEAHKVGFALPVKSLIFLIVIIYHHILYTLYH